MSVAVTFTYDCRDKWQQFNRIHRNGEANDFNSTNLTPVVVVNVSLPTHVVGKDLG